jgi:DNA-binding PadR family transcriptional regulator
MLEKKIEVCELVAYFPLMILYVLNQSQKPLLVEEIMEELERCFSKYIKVNRKSLDVTLSKLKKTDLVKVTTEDKHRSVRIGRRRGLFSITTEGKENFELTHSFISVFCGRIE